jgi:hypothetical protein
MMRGIRIRRVGAAGRSYTVDLPKGGSVIKVTVQEHGYELLISAKLNYNTISERQTGRVHTLLTAVLMEALGTAAELRRANVPLFSVDELQATPGHIEGINQR